MRAAEEDGRCEVEECVGKEGEQVSGKEGREFVAVHSRFPGLVSPRINVGDDRQQHVNLMVTKVMLPPWCCWINLTDSAFGFDPVP